MTNWLLRGLVYAAAMVVLRVIQGVLINTWETYAGLFSLALLAVFVIGVVLWGLRDGRDDANENPDPDRRGDLAMTWLIASLVAGVVSGAVAWLISLFDNALYVGGLFNELTTFAAFTALLVFVPAMAAVFVGRWLIDRQHAKRPQRHHGLALLEDGEDMRALDGGQADTDVFAAVSAGADAGESAAPAGDDATAARGGAAPAAGFTTEEFPTEGIEGEDPGKHRS